VIYGTLGQWVITRIYPSFPAVVGMGIIVTSGICATVGRGVKHLACITSNSFMELRIVMRLSWIKRGNLEVKSWSYLYLLPAEGKETTNNVDDEC